MSNTKHNIVWNQHTDFVGNVHSYDAQCICGWHSKQFATSEGVADAVLDHTDAGVAHAN